MFTVYKIHSDFYYVKNFEHDEFVCKKKDTLKKAKKEILVGDNVELSEDKNFIVNIIKRKNFLLRPKVSNIDLAVIVVSFLEPAFDFEQLDRYIAYLKYCNIKTVICFNKEDLPDNLDEIIEKIEKIYQNLCEKIFYISAKNKTGLDEFIKYINDKTIVLVGMSGVGKSSLLNAISPNINKKTGEVSKKTKRGVHTTRHCEIVEFDNFKVVDTPGFSRLKFDFLLPSEIINLFDDIKKFNTGCKYQNCLHDVSCEGICNIVDNLNQINPSRYKSYLTFLAEACDYKNEISKKSTKQEAFEKNTGDKKLLKISKQKRLQSRNTLKSKINKENSDV